MATAMLSWPLLLPAVIFYKEEKCPFYMFAGISRNVDYSVSGNVCVCMGFCPQHCFSATSESSVVQRCRSWYIALHGARFRVWALVFGEWVGLVFLPRSAFHLRLDWCLKLVYLLMLLCWEELGKIVSVKLFFAGIRSIKSLWVRCIAQYMARG